MNIENLNISIMNLNDLNQIKNTLEADFDNFWNYNILKNELQNPNSTYFVAKLNDFIIGFIGILIVLDIADVTNIVIKKSHRGNGFSKLLLDHIIQFCKQKKISQINLEVNSTNYTAINLYKKFGFINVGKRKNYYKNADGLLFTKYLKKE